MTFIQKILLVFVLTYSISLIGQHDMPIYEFNSIVSDAFPINRILIKDDFFLNRKELKIRQIIHRTNIYYGTDRVVYRDSVLDSATLNNFTTHHYSSIQYYNYDKNGLLNSYFIKPQVKFFPKEDSIIINKKNIVIDTTNGQTKISTYWKKNLVEQAVYKNDKILNKQEQEEYTELNGNIYKNVINVYKYKYTYDENGKLFSIYNNDKLESVYKYSKNKIEIKHASFHRGHRQYFVAYNKIHFNNRNQITSSRFCDSIDSKDHYTVFKNIYDKHHNIIRTTVYQKYFNAKPETLYEFENLYKDGILHKVIYKRPNQISEDRFVYEFDRFGFVKSVETTGFKETFEYLYY
jgi:hypothetical protein